MYILPVRMAWYSLVVAILLDYTPERAMMAVGYTAPTVAIPLDDRVPTIRERGNRQRKKYRKLTSEMREEVLTLRASGLTFKEIAQVLDISLTRAYDVCAQAGGR